MIAVIADDLTGAAELGGIGLRYGLRTEIRMAVGTAADADLLVIAADSRSGKEIDAVETMTTITRQLRNLQPAWIYKKTDSVLRGHVMAELKAHLQALDWQSALLVPANPLLGRTIRDGHYYLNDAPIHHSAFNIDPEFPILSPDVQDMLHTRRQPVLIRKTGDDMPVRGIVVGEVRDTDDLHTWAKRLPSRTLAAGAAGFFNALLDERLGGVAPPVKTDVVFGSPLLFISGSTFDASRSAIQRQFESSGPVRYMPDEPDSSWENEVIGLLRAGKAIVAIDAGPHKRSAHELRGIMAAAIGRILRANLPAEIVIEGGATAYAILRETGWDAFVPEQELAPGVVRMSVPTAPGLFITVKPGSYRWADSPII